LDGIAVVDVQAEGDVVWHAMAGPLSGDDVVGLVDWPRRFDHMQQHHGQHLLSAAFEHLHGLSTVSFHLGAESSTIDLRAQGLTEEQVVAAEELANRVIWEDHPVHARFVTPEELAQLPLRKAPAVEGPVRVVSAGDFDHSACGGTHPRSTGVVGLLHVRRWERRGPDIRVEFACGGRALRDLRTKNAVLSRVSTRLTLGSDELEAAIQRLQAAEQQARKRYEEATERVAGYEAGELVAAAPRVGGLAVVRRSYTDRALLEIKWLAGAIAARGGVALLGLAAEKVHLVFASPQHSTVDCGALLKETVARFGGKGGGQAAMAQGGIPEARNLDAALDAAFNSLVAPAPPAAAP
ncbi:MAG: alanyl-tRNA editing protein, partial [Gemmatimonadetes bacterium]|nr:alanyl-tRNA editing protein [Gemmatimonadota bacterium]